MPHTETMLMELWERVRQLEQRISTMPTQADLDAALAAQKTAIDNAATVMAKAATTIQTEMATIAAGATVSQSSIDTINAEAKAVADAAAALSAVTTVANPPAAG